MRILHLCKSLDTQLGGIQTHTRMLTAALAQQGVAVSVLTGVGWRGKEERLPHIPGVEVIPLRHLPGHRLRGAARLGDDLAFNLAASRWLARHQQQVDLIHVQGRSGLLHAACGPHHRPVVVTYHGLTREEYRHTHSRQGLCLDQWLHQAGGHALERRAYRRAARVITVSRYMAGQLEAHFGPAQGGLPVISNGVDQPPVSSAGQACASPATQWITFLGRLERNKGVHLLPDMLAQLPPWLGLRIIGQGQWAAWLRQDLQRRGLWARVHWVGPVPNEAVPFWLAQALALVVPSLYEPQGIVVLEAFAQGVPVVAADVGGLREMVRPGENGWLFPPQDVGSLTTCLQALAAHPELGTRLGQAGQAMVQARYQWSHIAAQTLQVYRSLLAPPPGPSPTHAVEAGRVVSKAVAPRVSPALSPPTIMIPPHA